MDSQVHPRWKESPLSLSLLPSLPPGSSPEPPAAAAGHTGGVGHSGCPGGWERDTSVLAPAQPLHERTCLPWQTACACVSGRPVGFWLRPACPQGELGASSPKAQSLSELLTGQKLGSQPVPRWFPGTQRSSTASGDGLRSFKLFHRSGFPSAGAASRRRGWENAGYHTGDITAGHLKSPAGQPLP